MQQPQTKALIALSITIVLWGILPVFIRDVSVALGAHDALIIRLFLSAIVYAIFATCFTGWRFPLKDLPQVALLSLVGLLGYYTFSIIGFSYAPAGIGTLIMSTMPILISLLAWFVGAERITPMTIIGLLISFGGSALLVMGDDLGLTTATKQDMLIGCGMIVLASVTWAFYVVFSRSLFQRHDVMKVTALCNIIVAMPLLPFLRLDMISKVVSLPTQTQVGLGLLCTVGTLSVIGWNYANPRLKPSVLGASLYLMPIIALVAGWFWLGEGITSQIVVAATIILCGVAIAQIKLDLSRFAKWLPIALLLFAATIWGGTPVAMRYMILDTSSATGLYARMVPAGLLALIFAVIIGIKPLSTMEWIRLVAASAIGGFGYQALSSFGIGLIPSSWTGVLFCLEPVFIALGAVMFMKEKMTVTAMIGLAIAMIGTALLALSGGGLGQASITGVLFIVASSVGWAIYTLLVRPIATKHGGLPIALLAVAIASLPTLLFTSATVVRELQSFSLAAWGASAYVAVLSTITAVVCWTVALPHVKSSQAAMFLYLQPLIATLGGVLLLGETLSTWFFLGGALILIGVFINQIDDFKLPSFKPNTLATAGTPK
jgi:drug/metabolite transporter (DMT)-like permease